MMPNALASSGWISTKGPGLSLFRVATLPVLVRVCHWCCKRPVLSTKGKASSGISAGIMCGRARKMPLPRSVANTIAGWWPSASTLSVWLTPLLR
ncbi:hypothetical protein D3C73_1147140 [compost metagenome]